MLISEKETLFSYQECWIEPTISFTSSSIMTIPIIDIIKTSSVHIDSMILFSCRIVHTANIKTKNCQHSRKTSCEKEGFSRCTFLYRDHRFRFSGGSGQFNSWETDCKSDADVCYCTTSPYPHSHPNPTYTLISTTFIRIYEENYRFILVTTTVLE